MRDARTIKVDEGAKTQNVALSVVKLVIGHLRFIVLCSFVGAIAAVLPSYVFGRFYEARSSFLPETSNSNVQRFAGLAAQFGISLPSTGSGETLDSYVEIAQSRAVLGEVVRRRFQLRPDGLLAKSVQGTLTDVYHVNAPSEAQREQLALRALRDNVDVTASQKSGLISVTTRGGSREFAESINRAILDALSKFNLEKRQTRASVERRFVQDRLGEAQKDVRTAEEAVRDFLARNRQYQSSPQLVIEYGRLQRRVDLSQQVQTSLAQAHEQARIEEVRNTPVITIVDRPEGSATVAHTRRSRALAGFTVGLALSLMAVAARDAAHRAARTSPEDFVDLRRQLGPKGARVLDRVLGEPQTP